MSNKVLYVEEIDRCTHCPLFSYGQNDPACFHEDNIKTFAVIPNSGAYADEGPPKNCPLRKRPIVKMLRIRA